MGGSALESRTEARGSDYVSTKGKKETQYRVRGNPAEKGHGTSWKRGPDSNLGLSSKSRSLLCALFANPPTRRSDWEMEALQGVRSGIWGGIPVGLRIDLRGGSPTLSRANSCISPASKLTLKEKEAQRGSETHPGSHSLEFRVPGLGS